MDKIGADFLYSVSTLHDRLQANAPNPIANQYEDDFPWYHRLDQDESYLYKRPWYEYHEEGIFQLNILNKHKNTVVIEAVAQ